MVRDPEQEPARWDEPIVASNPQEARKECQRRADQYGVELESVTEPRKVQARPQMYRCNYVEKD